MRLRRGRGNEAVAVRSPQRATMKMAVRKYTGRYECNCDCIEDENGVLAVSRCPDHGLPVAYIVTAEETIDAVVQEAP